MSTPTGLYAVTAHRPTAAGACATGSFTSASAINLVVSKTTRIEIYTLGADGITPVLDVPIYGRVAALQLVRPPGEDKDVLVFTTERNKVCVISYNDATGELETRAAGDMTDRSGRPAEQPLGLIDPSCRLIGAHLYEGLFKVIPMAADGTLQEMYNVRLEELVVLDIKFLHVAPSQAPVIAVLFQDNKDAVHVKTYKINMTNKELDEGPWRANSVGREASMLIPVPQPYGGVLVVLEREIAYHNGSAPVTVARRPSLVGAYGQVDADGQRFLLGDHLGHLHVLILEREGSAIKGLKVEQLGTTSLASCISYLDNGVVFVGSSAGDSQLVKLHKERIAETDSFIEVLESFANVGPICDFAVVDAQRQGQGQVVTCSGAYKDGSLRVIRNGIGINQLAEIDLEGIRGIWSLRGPGGVPTEDKYLVLAFVDETRVLAIEDGGVEDVDEITGFDLESRTLFAGNVLDDMLLQVTESAVRLVGADLALAGEWRPVEPAQSKINMCAASGNRVVVATGGGHLFFFEVTRTEVKSIGSTQMPHDVACLSLQGGYCAVGLWTDISIRILSVPSLDQVHEEKLGGNVIPRSLLYATMEGTDYLLAALGDGVLFTFVVDPQGGALLDRKKIAIATQPVTLTPFQSGHSLSVFAASDRPTVIYSSNRKLVYSTVNLGEVQHVCPLNNPSFPESLAIASQQTLTIGTIDDIQKLHVASMPLHEMPRRIVHYGQNGKFYAMLTMQIIESEGGEEEASFLRLVDTVSYEVVSSFELDKNEMGLSICSVEFEGDTASYIALGTGYVVAGETEPRRGRLLIFGLEDDRLVLATEHEIRGAAYAMEPFNGMLVTTCNARVMLFSLTQRDDGEKSLILVAEHHGHILSLYLATRGEFVLVGDLMKSVSVLIYRSDSKQLEEVAKDPMPNWVTSVAILDDDLYLGSECGYNLYAVKKNSEATTDDERSRLELVGEYHLGDQVNVIGRGSLSANSDAGALSTLLYGTVSGAIGMIVQLPIDKFKFLLKIQTELNKVIRGVGGLSHAEWRSFCSERKTAAARGFVDGDLVERFLDLDRPKMTEVADAVGASVEELCKVVEELSLLH